MEVMSAEAEQNGIPWPRQKPKPLPRSRTSQRRERNKACATYLASNLVVTVLLALVPDRTYLHERKDLWGFFAVSVGTTVILFLVLQASSPGYVAREEASEGREDEDGRLRLLEGGEIEMWEVGQEKGNKEEEGDDQVLLRGPRYWRQRKHRPLQQQRQQQQQQRERQQQPLRRMQRRKGKKKRRRAS